MTALAPPPPPPPAAPAPAAPTPASQVRRGTPNLGLGAGVDLALFAVTAAVAVALVRAFRSWDQLWPLLLVVAIAHGLSVLGRVLRLGATLATALLLISGIVVITLVYYRSQSWYGLPSAEVFRQAFDDAHVAFGPFQKLVAPVDDLPGFTVTFAAGLWLMAVFADLAAGRSDAPLQAVAPHVATFVFSSVLLLGRHALLSTVVFVTALALYRLAVRAARLRVAAGTRPGQRVVWVVGVPLLAAVLLASGLFARASPTDSGGMVDLRSIGRGPKARVVESPLVSLDSLLRGESNDVLFTVTSPTPHYWRLTALDDFDGRSWSASAKYRNLDSGERIPSPWDDDVAVERERIDVEIRDLESDWLPSLYAPTGVDAPVDLRFDDSSGSVFVADGESTASIDYSMDAAVADLDRSVLQAAGSPANPALDDFLALPADFPDAAVSRARSITAGLGAYDSAIALEDYFRGDGFRYDRSADYRGEEDPLTAFLDNGSGFCQQFATAFAAMARSIGLPSRVAVGFTYGDGAETVDPATGEATTTWTVRGRFAHAWPEVYVNGVGWVAFEPTPGRGNPDARSYSDVPPAQSDELGNSIELGATTTTTTTTIAPAQNGAVPTTAPDQLPPRPGDAADDTSGEPTSNTPTVVLLVIVGLAALSALLVRLRVVAVRRRRVRHRRTDVSTADRVSSSWAQTCRDLARVDVHATPSETPVEFATRAAKLVEVEDLVVLGRRESDRRFRATPPDEQEAASAERISDEVRDVVWSRLDRQQRLRADLDVG